MNKNRIVLASASPRRKELLQMLLCNFETAPAEVDESLQEGAPLPAEIIRLALQKAKTVAAVHAEPNTVVIGSDTMVVLDGVAFGKPQNKEDAVQMLKQLSGKTHTVLTAVAIVSTDGWEETALHTTKVTFYELSEQEIVRYVESGEPLDKAGAYGIQGQGALLVRSIEGDYYSVMGLPVAQVYRLLRAHDIVE